MWYVGDSPHPEISISFVFSTFLMNEMSLQARRVLTVNVRIDVSRRRIRIRPSVTSGRKPFGPVMGGEAILRDRYRLGHLSVVLIPNTYER